MPIRALVACGGGARRVDDEVVCAVGTGGIRRGRRPRCTRARTRRRRSNAAWLTNQRSASVSYLHERRVARRSSRRRRRDPPTGSPLGSGPEHEVAGLVEDPEDEVDGLEVVVRAGGAVGVGRREDVARRTADCRWSRRRRTAGPAAGFRLRPWRRRNVARPGSSSAAAPGPLDGRGAIADSERETPCRAARPPRIPGAPLAPDATGESEIRMAAPSTTARTRRARAPESAGLDCAGSSFGTRFFRRTGKQAPGCDACRRLGELDHQRSRSVKESRRAGGDRVAQ